MPKRKKTQHWIQPLIYFQETDRHNDGKKDICKQVPVGLLRTEDKKQLS